jgi:hypothetical protein
VRYRSIATDIVLVAFDPRELPLFEGPDARRATAIALAAIASLEGGLAADVDDGRRRGLLGEVTLWQVLVSAERAKDLLDDRREAVRTALRMARASFAACAQLPLLDRLAVYTTGRCYRSQAESRARLGRAFDWLVGHPVRPMPTRKRLRRQRLGGGDTSPASRASK